MDFLAVLITTGLWLIDVVAWNVGTGRLGKRDTNHAHRIVDMQIEGCCQIGDWSSHFHSLASGRVSGEPCLWRKGEEQNQQRNRECLRSETLMGGRRAVTIPPLPLLISKLSNPLQWSYPESHESKPPNVTDIISERWDFKSVL